MEDTNNLSSVQTQTLPFTFTGKGSEYFSIWIVNLALTIVTLGIYSAWAKVRKLQYLYRNTSLGGSSFDYHGNPIAILKGRGIALAALIGVQLALQFAPIVGLVLLLLIFAVMAWMIKRSLQFKLHNSSYRGLRFSFHGSTGGAYRVFLWLTVVAALLGFLWPYTHHQIKSYQHNNSRYGQTDFTFSGTVGQFYKVYLIAGLMGMAALVLFFVLVGGAIMQMFAGGGETPRGPITSVIGIVILIFFFAVYQAIVGPYIQARLQNIVWNNTKLGPHGFVSNVSARKLFAITFTNFILIVLTLGLFKPFAVIRLLRYRLSTMAFVPHGSLEAFLAGQSQQQSATGEETAEMFDVDISF
jgi:uncharacterized membrane protein YjgN (DUF898 family)